MSDVWVSNSISVSGVRCLSINPYICVRCQMSEYQILYLCQVSGVWVSIPISVSGVRCLSLSLCQDSMKLAQETDKCEMFTERLKKELHDSGWPQILSSIFDSADFNLICTISIAGIGACFHFLFVWPCLAVWLCVCPCVGLSALLCTTIMCTTIICQAYGVLDKTCSNCLSIVCDSVRYVVLNKNNPFVCLL